MTQEQENLCVDIIKTYSRAALAAGAISELAVNAVQIKMILQLADVFEISMTKAAATGILNSFFAGSFLLEAARWIFPPSRILTAVKAANQTEDLGWKCAKDFSKG